LAILNRQSHYFPLAEWHTLTYLVLTGRKTPIKSKSFPWLSTPDTSTIIEDQSTWLVGERNKMVTNKLTNSHFWSPSQGRLDPWILSLSDECVT